ncbi:hypothetical protein K1W54_25170 [Micromonospora sp. CPCC 205371]|nr:hypothetical protein [Micromonospora sp. CPCC 205371]
MSTVEDFFAQHDDWPWNPPRPGRATFHYLIASTEGELRHDVDYVTRTVAPGQWLWVRPGTGSAGIRPVRCRPGWLCGASTVNWVWGGCSSAD